MESLADFLGVQGTQPAPSDAPSPKLTAKAFCREVLSSQEYRDSIYRRIIIGELPPAIEAMMWDRAHGKTVEKVEVRDTTNPLESLSAEQLEERAVFLAAVARRMRASNQKEQEPQGSVH